MRRASRRVAVGAVFIGGDSPVSVQSMTNTKTEDVRATVRQIEELKAAGCEIVRVAVPNMAAAHAIAEIKSNVDIPIVADIHFDYRLALESCAAGADKIRVNPGNIGSPERVQAVVRACAGRGIPIRIGVNGGSLEREILERYGSVTAAGMVESAAGHIALLRRYDFEDICVSLKASSVPLTVEANRLFAERFDYPMHLGITEAGTRYTGLVQSSVGLGALLLDGIGDTIRVSLTADPVEEIAAARSILRASGLRSDGVRVISCPSCGRCDIDLIGTAEEVERRVSNIKNRDITVAVMGCVVNGPGEAREADYGLAGGKGQGLLFRRGEIVGKVPERQLVDALLRLIDTD